MIVKLEILLDLPSKEENPLGYDVAQIRQHAEWMVKQLSDRTGNIFLPRDDMVYDNPIFVSRVYGIDSAHVKNSAEEVTNCENEPYGGQCIKCGWFAVKTIMGPSCLNQNCEMP